MAEDQPSKDRQLTGDDIIAEVLRNSEAGQFSIRRTVLLPSIYHIYLHSADFESIRPVIPALSAEARSALIERLDELNRKKRPSAVSRYLGFDEGKTVEYKILDPDWTVEFHPDAEEKLERGDIEVYSELASAARPEFEGAMTRHVTRKLSESTARSQAPERTAAAPANAATEGVFGWLRYGPNGSEQVFPITKHEIVVGRGGKTFWVDLKLDAPPDVSREHFRLRRDMSSGRFYLKNTSQYGTTVNGKAIPPGDLNVEVPLPREATISLAGVFTIKFEAAESG